MTASRKASMVGGGLNRLNSLNSPGSVDNSSKKLNEHGSSSRLDSLEWDDVVHREIKQSELELDDDYCEMIIQVIFVTSAGGALLRLQTKWIHDRFFKYFPHCNIF